MMDVIRDALLSVLNVFKSIRPADIIDIAILSYLIFHGIKLIRETRAQQLVKGIFLLIAFKCITIGVECNLNVRMPKKFL